MNEHHAGAWAANYRINPLSGRIIENPLNGYYRVGLVDTPLPELVTLIGPNVRWRPAVQCQWKGQHG